MTLKNLIQKNKKVLRGLESLNPALSWACFSQIFWLYVFFSKTCVAKKKKTKQRKTEKSNKMLKDNFGTDVAANV
jgi:hypothetical protein